MPVGAINNHKLLSIVLEQSNSWSISSYPKFIPFLCFLLAQRNISFPLRWLVIHVTSFLNWETKLWLFRVHSGLKLFIGKLLSCQSMVNEDSLMLIQQYKWWDIEIHEVFSDEWITFFYIEVRAVSRDALRHFIKVGY